MNCAIPCAPAELTSSERNLLSCQSRRTKNPIGILCSWAAALTVSQITSADLDFFVLPTLIESSSTETAA